MVYEMIFADKNSITNKRYKQTYPWLTLEHWRSYTNGKERQLSYFIKDS
jgi:hypothetical protein